MNDYIVDNYKKRKLQQVFFISVLAILLAVIISGIVLTIAFKNDKTLIWISVAATVVCIIAFCVVLLVSIRYLRITSKGVKLFNGVKIKSIEFENIKTVELAFKKYPNGIKFWKIIIHCNPNEQYSYIIDDFSKDLWRLKEAKCILKQKLPNTVSIQDNWAIS